MQGTGYVNPYVVAEAPASERATFIRRTYTHLAGSLLVFAGIEAMLLQTPLAGIMFKFMGTSQMAWLIILGAFMLVSWVAQSWAQSGSSQAMQYAGLGLYVVAQAVIFLPLIAIAAEMAPDAIPSAAVVTLALFLGLTGVVVVTRKDFSFLRGILMVSGFVALAAIVASMIFGFALPTVLFASLMVLLAGGAILYQTSQIMLNYRTDQHVAAALGLFASVAMMFYYILQIFLSRRS